MTTEGDEIGQEHEEDSRYLKVLELLKVLDHLLGDGAILHLTLQLGGPVLRTPFQQMGQHRIMCL